jgi:hypothetical protein
VTGPPPAARPLPHAGGTSAPPAVEVCPVDVRFDGQLLKRLSQGAADQLVCRGWAEWPGAGRRRHLGLTASAPLSSMQHGWGSHDGTRPMRADGTGRRAAGQAFGQRASHLEHVPVNPIHMDFLSPEREIARGPPPPAKVNFQSAVPYHGLRLLKLGPHAKAKSLAGRANILEIRGDGAGGVIILFLEMGGNNSRNFRSWHPVGKQAPRISPLLNRANATNRLFQLRRPTVPLDLGQLLFDVGMRVAFSSDPPVTRSA